MHISTYNNKYVITIYRYANKNFFYKATTAVA